MSFILHRTFDHHHHRYTTLYDILPAGTIGWRQLYRRRTECIVHCQQALDSLASQYFREIGGNRPFIRTLFIHFRDIERVFIEQEWFDPRLTIDILRRIVNDVDANRLQHNLTQRCYARHVLDYVVRFVQTRPLIEQWLADDVRDLMQGRRLK